MYRLRTKFVVGLIAAAILLFGIANAIAQVHVRGYTRKDGTYVRPHQRSRPDGNFYNNYSTYGNINPHTGKAGTRRTPPDNYGRDVYVRGYTRSDGTRVSSHMRSAPDGIFENNWSTIGNFNPYAGKPGTRVTPPEGYGRSSGSIGSKSPTYSDENSDGAYSSLSDDWASKPEQVEPPRVNPHERRNRVYNTLSDEEKSEHSVAVDKLKESNGREWTWGLYAPSRLRGYQERVNVAERIGKLGVTIDWHKYSLEKLLELEQVLLDTEPAFRPERLADIEERRRYRTEVSVSSR